VAQLSASDACAPDLLAANVCAPLVECLRSKFAILTTPLSIHSSHAHTRTCRDDETVVEALHSLAALSRLEASVPLLRRAVAPKAVVAAVRQAGESVTVHGPALDTAVAMAADTNLRTDLARVCCCLSRSLSVWDDNSHPM
jgi:hypothetical protein